MIRLQLLLAAVLAAFVLTDGAAGATPTAYDRCRRAAVTTLALGDCNAVELRRVDRILNETYRRLTARLTSGRRTLLIQAEERWIAFRDGECAFVASQAAGGTLAPILHGSCLIRLTAERTADLRRHLRP